MVPRQCIHPAASIHGVARGFPSGSWFVGLFAVIGAYALLFLGAAVVLSDLPLAQPDQVAQASPSFELIERARSELQRGDLGQAERLAREAAAADPASEFISRFLTGVLSRTGRKREALAEADRFIARGAPSALLRANRGFLRRELGDIPGAMDDFEAALRVEGLTSEQRRNVEASLAESRTAAASAELNQAQTALARGEFDHAIAISGQILQRDPNSEIALRIRIEALSRAGSKREALTEVDRYLARTTGSGLLRAQRGFLRRELGDMPGASEDFAAALAAGGLATEQRQNVEAASAEIRSSEAMAELTRAQAALNGGNLSGALQLAGAILARDPDSKVAQQIVVDALVRGGQRREALDEAERFIGRGSAGGYQYAQRGFLRQQLGNRQGAQEDFTSALATGELTAEQRRNIVAALAEIKKSQVTWPAAVATARSRREQILVSAKEAERRRQPDEAIRIYRQFVAARGASADAWFELGYLLLRQGREVEAGEAFLAGLELRPVGQVYLDAGYTYVYSNPPLAAMLFRRGLDRWYSGDPSLAQRSETDIERVKNEIVKADSSIQTTLAAGGILARPAAAGGHQYALFAETRVRFDGRYLPNVPGFEVVARGYHGRDFIGTVETIGGIGLRWRPFRNIDFSIGVQAEHYFDNPRNQVTFYWGLGVGAQPYPYETGWLPYWDFAAFGAYRTLDARLLQDFSVNAGFLYRFRGPVRAAIGPTILAVAGYDSLAGSPWAAGIGPSVMAKFWLGGDKYRSYDAILQLQAAYLTSIGADERQRGWRVQGSVTY